MARRRRHSAIVLGGWSGEAVTLCALVAAVAFGQALFFRTPIALTLGAVAGLVAGLGCSRWWTASCVAAAGVGLGAAAGVAVGRLSAVPAAAWLPDVLKTAAMAAALAAGIAYLIRMREDARAPIAALAVAAVVVTMWLSAISLANTLVWNGLPSIASMERVPAYSASMSDEDLYLSWIARLRAGEPYYPMAVRSFAEASAVSGSASFVRIRSPFSYRPPTLYVVLAALPPRGISLVVAVMMVCSVGVVAAYVLARQYVVQSAALAAAVLVATAFSAYGAWQLLDAESWSGAFALACVAAFVVSRSQPRRGRWSDVLPVGFALAATAFRELAAPLLLLGLAATLTGSENRARRTWIFWVGGLAIAAVGLSAHWFAAANAFASAAAQTVDASWFHPDGTGLAGAVVFAAKSASLSLAAAGILLLLGAVGSLSAPEDRPSRLVLAGVAVGGPLVLLLVHPPGYQGSNVAPGYWFNIVWPTVLACVPLAFARIAAVRRR